MMETEGFFFYFYFFLLVELKTFHTNFLLKPRKFNILAEMTHGTVAVKRAESFINAVMAYSLVTTEELAVPTTFSRRSTTSLSLICQKESH